jgi:hypothetical protein
MILLIATIVGLPYGEAQRPTRAYYEAQHLRAALLVRARRRRGACAYRPSRRRPTLASAAPASPSSAPCVRRPSLSSTSSASRPALPRRCGASPAARLSAVRPLPDPDGQRFVVCICISGEWRVVICEFKCRIFTFD